VAEANGRVYHPLMQWEQIAETNAGSVGIEVHDPMTGWLDPDDARVLYEILAACTSTPEVCWIGIWNGGGALNGPYSRSVARLEPMAHDPAPDLDIDIESFETRWEEVAATLRTAPRFEHPGRNYFLARGPCRSIPVLIEGFLHVTPNLAWPDDQAWCVASEIDFDSTLVGASRACADALLRDDRLEAVEVAAEDRLDIEGDILNDRISQI
jgi:hypothetical protein